MDIKKKQLHLGKVYFWYLFFAIFLQILGINGRFGQLDTVWKAGVISTTLLYVVWKYRWKVTGYIIMPCLIYLLGQTVAILLNPGGSISTFINCAIVIAMAYLFMSLSSNNSSFELSDMIWFVNAFIALMVYAVVYNFFKDPKAVLNVLSNKSVYADMISSFFDNKQTFGMFLFTAVITSVYGYVLRGKKWYVVLAVFFFVNLYICSSRTALAACAVFVLLMGIFLLRSHKKMALAILGFVSLAAVIILVVPSLRNFTEDVLLDTDATMDVRTGIWQDAFRAMKGEKIIFGYGETNVTNAIASVSNRKANTHNGIIQVLLSGGIIKLFLYMCVIAKSIFCCRRIKKHNGALAGVFLAALISTLVFSMGEALVLLDTSAPCIVASVMCLAFPVAADGYYQRISTEESDTHE